MKLLCECGHVIVDIGLSDHIKGLILREQSCETTYEQPAATIAEFIQAVCDGRRSEWIKDFYGRGGVDIEDSNVVYDIILYSHVRAGLKVYQCEECGRIYIQRAPQSDMYRSFKPEDEDWQGTLSDA